MDLKKFVFILPNSRWFDSAKWELYPYNVCLLAAIIKDEYEVKIIDANAKNLSLKQTVQKALEFSPNYIALSCLAVEYSKHAHELAKSLKESMPNTPVILGGVYGTLLPEHAIEDKNFDYLVLGEGEIRLKQLLKHIENKTLPEDLDGIAYRKGDEVIIKPQETYVEDLDNLPYPDYNLVDFDDYCRVNEKFSYADTRDALPVAKMYTSRGCPAGCNFCAVEHIAGKRFRKRSVESILDEIEFMIQKYKVKEILFYDDNLIFDIKRAKELCKGIIKRQFNIKFKCPNIAVYCLDNELMDLMKEAGFTMLVFAIESANDRILKYVMGKPLSIEGVKEKVEYAKKLGFRCAALFVIGSPGETWQEIRNSFAFAEKLDVYCHFSIATPLPKTRLYNDAVKENLLIDGFSFFSGSGCSKGWIETDEFTAFDLEVLRAYDWERINFSTPEKMKNAVEFFKLPEKEILEWSKGATESVRKRFYK